MTKHIHAPRVASREALTTKAALVAVALASWGCTSSNQTVTLQSLQASGRTSFLCLSSETYAARSLNDCPDQVPPAIDGETRHLYSMVTQTVRGEVAVVDLTSGGVVDEDQTIPGFTLLPVGGVPTSIVSTPGSVATFVGVGQAGTEGIFAIPSSCVKPRTDGEPQRSLTTWSACRLPSAPGDMAILVDPPADPSKPNEVRASCGGLAAAVSADALQTSRECPADLSGETTPPGRRKLAVVLPDRGELVVIDGQELLDRPPGTYEPCVFERQVPLRVDLPAEPIAQMVPPDLAGGPKPVGLLHPPPSIPFTARPGGLAQVDDPVTQEHRLFLADLDAPVVHVLDTRDPCDIRETPPLLPMSFVDPNRVVTTSRVAASPLTSDEKRYLYAIDPLDGGSVMFFDVSPGSSNRTPLLRPNSPLVPFEPPDRIAFNSPARDVTFALHDMPVAEPPTETQAVGVFCDPTPGASTAYRPSSDLSSGARPGELRGVFGFLALESGQISVIDVEDFDAKCRRPVEANGSPTPDFRGCSSDPDGPYEIGSVPTVTNEVSCRMIESHRARSSTTMRNDATVGVRAPSLRLLPKLTDDSGRTLVTDRSPEGLNHPRMLGVNFSPTQPGQVYVGTTLYTETDPSNKVVFEPAAAQESSLVLSFAEPRTYAPDEVFNARFEGPLVDERPGATYAFDEQSGSATLSDSGIVFCDAGVEDQRAAQDDLGTPLGVTDLQQFGRFHADYARILSDIPARDNTWWSRSLPAAESAACGGATADERYLRCSAQLGTSIAPGALRELSIDVATRNVLTVHPRSESAGSSGARDVAAFLECCFPTTVSYEVRGSHEWIVRGAQSGFRNRITSDGSGRCVVDPDPIRQNLRSRVVEISCADGCGQGVPDGAPAIGPPIAGEVACIFDSAHPPSVTIGADGSACIYHGLSASFAIYAGQPKGATPSSQRDMTFAWEVLGGFSPLILGAGSDTNTSPQSIVFSPQTGSLVVADGASRGIVTIDLSTLAATSIL